MGLMQLAELEFGQAVEASGHEVGLYMCMCVCICAHMDEDSLSLLFFFFAFYFVIEYRRLTML